MKKTLLTLFGIALAVAVVVQGIYLYRINDRLDSLDSTPAAVTAQPDNGLTGPGDLFGNNGVTSQGRDPLAEMHRMQERMNRLFDRSFSRFQQGQQADDLFGSNGFSPSLDLEDEGDEYRLKINMPGARASDIDVSIDDNRVLTVEATTRDGNERRDEGRVLRRERYIGQFRRRLTLPEAVDPSTLHSDYQDGVLTLSVKKQSAVS